MSGDYGSVLSRTIGVIQNELESASEVSAETKLIADLDLDSLQVIQVIAALEDEFDIVIPLEDLPEIDTVGDAARLLTELLGAEAANQ